MRIAFVYTIGRPGSFSNRTFEQVDFGGSEGCMIRYAQALAKLGHEVKIFTSGAPSGESGSVKWREARELQGETFDVAIAHRFPDALPGISAKLKVLFSHDSEVPDLPYYVDQGHVNLVIVVSKYHKENFQRQHPIREDLYLVSNSGLTHADYQDRDIPKIPGRCIYCSAPSRGLVELIGIWPMIHGQLPHATLHVTGSFALWGLYPKKIYCIDALKALKGATYLGLLSREELVKEQLQSQMLLLPGNLGSPEMCCMSAMECAAAGNAIIVSDIAALPERVVEGQTGYVIERKEGWRQIFARCAVELLSSPKLEAMQSLARALESEHDYSVLAPQWVAQFEEMLGK